MHDQPSQQTSAITDMRNGDGFSRVVCSIVGFSVIWLSLYPSLLVAQSEFDSPEPLEQMAEPVEGQLNHALVELESTIRKIATNVKAKEPAAELWGEIEELESQIHELDADITTNFDRILAKMEGTDLPDTIVDRHTEAVSHYKNQLESLFGDIDKVRNEKDVKKVAKLAVSLADRISSIKKKRNQQYFDPNSLPNKSFKPSTSAGPKTSALEYLLADPVGDARHLRASIESTPPVGENAFSNPAWLSESDEVNLSQAVIDRANELQNDPVQIYHWVRNNIQWNPDWGSKQNAQLTLELRSGNAMDIASLTVALMRASNIPARYAHGTIDVKPDEFRNWAGGFDDVQAAMNFGSSGGLPLGPVISGGAIVGVRMEHVWVEIAVDYTPSRGARNTLPDTWLAIDPSFKQYEYLEGLDPLALLSTDLTQLAGDYGNSGTVNDAEGWVGDLDPAVIAAAQDSVRAELEDYVSANFDNPTVGDVIGGTQTIVQDFPSLAANLPNSIVVEGMKYASIPAQLQQKLTFALNTPSLFSQDDAPVTLPWPVLNNKKITLAFTGATPADEAALAAFLPDEAITDASQLPTSFPAYLVNVRPEIRIDGEVVLTGGTVTLGEEIDFRFDVEFPGFGVVPNQYSVPAGSYLSVNAISNSVSSSVMSDLRQRIAETQSVVTSGDTAQISQLSDELVLGDVFYGLSTSYYGQLAVLADVTTRKQESQHTLLAGLGTIGYEPSAQFLFGIPTELNHGGIVLNLPQVSAIGAESNERKFQMSLAIGTLSSALEHLVPEQTFNSDASVPIEAVSTIKAFQIAMAEGQRLYRITAENLNSTIGQINLDAETVAEISQSAEAGKHIIVHTDEVSIPGWSGAGYMIIDPLSGDGAYKISGGANGGFTTFLGFLVLAVVLFAMIAFITFALLVSPVLTIMLGLIIYSVLGTVDLVTDVIENCQGIELFTNLFVIATAEITAGLAGGPLGVAIAAAILTSFVPRPEYAC